MKPINVNLSNIFIDIDDTLTRNMGDTFIKGSISYIKALSDKGNVFIWSQGGMEYALEIVHMAGLDKFVCLVLPKPDLMIDDKSCNDWCGLLSIKNEEPSGWEVIETVSQNIEGDWVEDSPVLRAINK